MKSKQKAVSIIIPTRNAKTTVLKTLESLKKQTYPIKEIIIIDNASKDNTISLIEKYKKKVNIKIKIIKRKRDYGVGVNYNYASKQARSPLIVFMHSDSELPGKNELKRLVSPLVDSENVVAAYSTIFLPYSVWETYNFWQKCLFARSVGKNQPGLNGKFDCLRKKVFLDLGGFNEKNWDRNAGGEDADLHSRLKKIGDVVLSEARVIHLHYIGSNYSLQNWIGTRKLLACTYGRLFRVNWREFTAGTLVLLIKPILAILPFFPSMTIYGIILLFLFAILYSRALYTRKSTLLNPRIILLPFIEVFLVYFETFWMLESFLFLKKKV